MGLQHEAGWLRQIADCAELLNITTGSSTVKVGLRRIADEIDKFFLFPERKKANQMELQIADIRTLLGHEPRVILEIGSNDGTDSEKFLAEYPECILHCFEPEIRAVDKWNRRLSGHPRAKLWQVALSDENGTAMFHRSGGCPPNRPDIAHEEWDKSGSLQQPTGHLQHSEWCKFDHDIEVLTTKLDVWMHSWTSLQPLGEIDLAWIDVQGAEARVLAGATETIPKIKMLYLEVHATEMYAGQPTVEQLDAMLPGHQRQPTDYSENFLFVRKDL